MFVDNGGHIHLTGLAGNSVFVNWDANGDVYRYNYGHGGLYSVLLVDEPRSLLPGQPLNVGCHVTPGVQKYF